MRILALLVVAVSFLGSKTFMSSGGVEAQKLRFKKGLGTQKGKLKINKGIDTPDAPAQKDEAAPKEKEKRPPGKEGDAKAKAGLGLKGLLQKAKGKLALKKGKKAAGALPPPPDAEPGASSPPSPAGDPGQVLPCKECSS